MKTIDVGTLDVAETQFGPAYVWLSSRFNLIGCLQAESDVVGQCEDAESWIGLDRSMTENFSVEGGTHLDVGDVEDDAVGNEGRHGDAPETLMGIQGGRTASRLESIGDTLCHVRARMSRCVLTAYCP